MVPLKLLPASEYDRVRAGGGDADLRLALLADMCRLNALVAVKRAGSGHLGSTFSSLDIVAHLLFSELNVAELGFEDPTATSSSRRRGTTSRASTRRSSASA